MIVSGKDVDASAATGPPVCQMTLALAPALTMLTMLTMLTVIEAGGELRWCIQDPQ